MKKYLIKKNLLTIIAIATLVAMSGCSKKEKTTTAPLTPPVEPATATPAIPTTANSSVPVDPSKLFADADAALKANAYDRAAQALIAAQAQKTLTEQQAIEAQNRMIGLQRSLADGVARGDASAIAAANIIRQAHMVH